MPGVPLMYRRLVVLLFVAACLVTTSAPAQPLLREGRGENEVVLIHGLGADAGIWDNVLGYLGGSTQAFAYELHGHGTTRPLATPTIAAEAAALGEWLKAKDLPYPTLVGHGLGGMIALQFALDHPADVRRVILIDATPAPARDGRGPAGTQPRPPGRLRPVRGQPLSDGQRRRQDRARGRGHGPAHR